MSVSLQHTPRQSDRPLICAQRLRKLVRELRPAVDVEVGEEDEGAMLCTVHHHGSDRNMLETRQPRAVTGLEKRIIGGNTVRWRVK